MLDDFNYFYYAMKEYIPYIHIQYISLPKYIFLYDSKILQINVCLQTKKKN